MSAPLTYVQKDIRSPDRDTVAILMYVIND